MRYGFFVACCFLPKFIHLIFYFATMGRSCLFITIIFLVYYSAFTDIRGVFVFEVVDLEGKHGIIVEYFTPLLPRKYGHRLYFPRSGLCEVTQAFVPKGSSRLCRRNWTLMRHRAGIMCANGSDSFVGGLFVTLRNLPIYSLECAACYMLLINVVFK